ncbi:TBC1 domain family member 5 homolog B-like isoform X1 [Amphibalanus amphitrite]|uniref:TBC1 domain family member 5 homolog B-like isoform X1 n=1 Tax=Amphibalanus amphitrite TaxID=1232801 RepID=UPI001C8FB102|nr:TBC1 domain family member 5 homolog B-like isoform X1 [Amphibalanus amphitrite]XP_043234403.1 TBC1 domain family member 5 homolog B-like isoform X1 [Amphibalanus amphitrite]XP_043234404.1 TBC1 domain family member 5 homolog B-like isoform X1 [Amphibalanus amphitrite]XP_043234405.1 TBC1 domain family member 5 homolog B-like isoform X1 [Amphibalanus amphitrite]XP_043234406.1 TBC1 domain family member 5 homolog B-like isoform X1 [Amphibalanus amphitrite]XP_043234407.1 TBC1 domain family member
MAARQEEPGQRRQASPAWARDASTKYLLEFERYFSGGAGSFGALHEQALLRQLAGCGLRSLAWRLFLQVLPVDPASWELLTKEHRRLYSLAKTTYSDYTDVNDTRIRCEVNNPLSHDEQSPWHRLFEHADLRRVIEQDVVRTMPDVALFRDEHVCRCMTDVLFVFMQKHPEVDYVQGMHELLAPIIYLLRREYSNFADVRAAHRANHPTFDLLEVLLDKDYVEHDAFYMLEKLLKMMDWSSSVNRRREYEEMQRAPPPAPDLLHPPLFAKDRASPSVNQWGPSPCNRAVRRHLCMIDYDLYLKLAELGVEPQVFGLKMFRLLFGREFRLSELCSVWDALLADSHATSTLDLVPYVFCAILIYNRRQILEREGMEALTLLLNLPPLPDIAGCIAFALHIRNPLDYPKPNNFPPPPPVSPRKPAASKIRLRRRSVERSKSAVGQPKSESGSGSVSPARPRSMTQPPPMSAPGRTGLVGLARSGSETVVSRSGSATVAAASADLVTYGPPPVAMKDVSALRGKHALLASSEASAYAVMESKQTSTPPEWNPVSEREPLRCERKSVESKSESVHSESEPVHSGRELVHSKSESAHSERDPTHSESEPAHCKNESAHSKSEPAHNERDSVHAEREAVRSETEAVHRDLRSVHSGSADQSESEPVSAKSQLAHSQRGSWLVSAISTLRARLQTTRIEAGSDGDAVQGAAGGAAPDPLCRDHGPAAAEQGS